MSWFRDLRYGARSLLKSPGLMIVATLALGFGIGLTATMWSIIYGAMIKGLPYDDPQSIVAVFRTNPSRDIDRMGVTVQDFADWQKEQKSFSQLGAFTCGTFNVSGTEDKAERFDGCWMTGDAMSIPRVSPLKGRLFQAADDKPGADRVAMIGYSMWQNRYGAADDIVGKPIRVNGQPYTIIGVMPEGFLYPQNTQIWAGLTIDPLATQRRDAPQYQVVARIKPTSNADEANVDLDRIMQRIESENKETNEGVRALVQPYVKAFIGPEPTRLLYTMLGAVGLVLLIACANVANLLLDRAAHKTKEVGIRTALGASRMAVVRQFLAEAVILSALGAVIGAGIAQAGVTLFTRAIADTQPPFFIDIQLHPPVLLFIVGIALLASLVSGFLPAFQSSRADINEILKDESRGASSLHIGKMSKALVMFEIALSCGLLVAAGLMTKSVTKLRNIDPGFDAANVFTARVGFPVGMSDSVKQRMFWEQLPGRLAEIPGVRAVSVSTGLPGVNMNDPRIVPEGKTYSRPQDMPEARTLGVTPDFFKTFQIPIRQGRAFTEADRRDAPKVAIINQKFAETHFPGADPIGRRFRIPEGADSLEWRTVVGVVPNVFVGDNENPWAPVFFEPFAQAGSNFASMALLNSGPPMAITQQVREAVASLDADLPIYWVYSMQEAMARPTWFIRIFGTMFMIFGGIALFLAGIGLYAVMAFSVSRRTREVGIRMALGASSGNVVSMIFKQGMLQMGVGLAFGLALAFGVSRLLSMILFDVQPRDPQIFGGVVGVLLIAGALACFFPARRATAVDPMVALRD